MGPWHSKKSLGPQALCRVCRLRERESGCAGLCSPCKALDWDRKRSALQIANRLYGRDHFFKPLYGWIGRQIKTRDSRLVLQVVRQIAERYEVHGWKPRDLISYLQGTLRKMELKQEAEKLRRAKGEGRRGEGPAHVGEILKGLL